MPLSRMLGMFLVSSGAIAGLSMSVPSVAVADTTASAATSAASPSNGESSCDPVHLGPDWRWHKNNRVGHWDHWQWNREEERWEWLHYWRDDRRCTEASEQGQESDRPSDS